MKYTSKRVYQNARKSKRRMNRMQTGGSKITLVSEDARNPKTKINEWGDLNEAKVTDDITRYKYDIETQGEDSFTLKNIEAFRISARPTMAKMIRDIYDIPDKGSKFYDRWLSMGKHRNVDSAKFAKQFIEIPTRSGTSYPDYTFTHDKIGSIDVPDDLKIDKDRFKTRTLNYFKKLNGQSITDEAAQGPAQGPAQGGPDGQSSLSQGAPSSIIVPSGSNVITEGDQDNIKKIIPDAKFEDGKLLSKTTIVKSPDGKYYATTTDYNVNCEPAAASK